MSQYHKFSEGDRVKLEHPSEPPSCLKDDRHGEWTVQSVEFYSEQCTCVKDRLGRHLKTCIRNNWGMFGHHQQLTIVANDGKKHKLSGYDFEPVNPNKPEKTSAIKKEEQ